MRTLTNFSIGLVVILMNIGIAMAQDPTPTQASPDTTQAVQDTVKWTKNGAASLSFANVGLSNWAGGGQSSISLGVLLSGKAVRENSKSTWESFGNFALGSARVGDRSRLFKKTDDLLVAGTKYGRKLSEIWSLTASTELRSQMLPGLSFRENPLTGKEEINQRLSSFFAPGYISTGLGFQFRKKVISLNVAPVSNRLTIVLDDSLSQAGAFGVEPGKKVLSDIGPNFRANLDYNIFENVNLKSSLNMFCQYKDLRRIDTNWDVLIVMKVNKYLNTSFGTNLIYFNDVLIPQSDGTQRQAVQFKHVLNVNVGVKF